MINWKIELIEIKKLKEHARNPRQISKEQAQHLKNLIEKFGLIDKPIINLDMTIIGGHQRIKIIKKMKQKTVECWMPDRLLTDAEIDHLCVGLNLNQGSWDFDILANDWDVLDLIDYGFSEKMLIGSTDEDEKKEGTEKAKEKKTKTHSCPVCGHEF